MEQQNTTSQQESDSHITLKSILGGDILAHSFLKRQANLLILIVLLTILYIDNRYSSQHKHNHYNKRVAQHDIFQSGYHCINPLF